MKKVLILIFFSLIIFISLKAQFTLDGQLIQRSEFRNGYSRLIPESEDPAFFIAHRVRLQAQYVLDSFTFYASIQDVRTWGNTPLAKLSDPFLSLHEGWVQYAFHRNWRIKLGRQELNYDNVRFLGNLDWALQGRAHDFALIKYENNNFKLHFGGGYNQDGMALSGNIYTGFNQYKTAHMLWMEKKWKKFSLSFLAWNDGRQYVIRDSIGTIVEKGQHFRLTLGLSSIKYDFGKTLLSGFYYHQLGKIPNGLNVNAFDVSAQITQTLFSNIEKGSSFKVAAGFEIVSGRDMFSGLSGNQAFSPLYGTNHTHNGYMDYFYVGNWENIVGLQDYYLKFRYAFNPKIFTQLDGHAFLAHGTPVRIIPNPLGPGTLVEMDKYLGTEIDFSFGYLFHRAVSLQFGYSHMLPSETFEYLNGDAEYKDIQNWAYLMLIFRPNMKNKNIGIYF